MRGCRNSSTGGCASFEQNHSRDLNWSRRPAAPPTAEPKTGHTNDFERVPASLLEPGRAVQELRRGGPGGSVATLLKDNVRPLALHHHLPASGAEPHCADLNQRSLRPHREQRLALLAEFDAHSDAPLRPRRGLARARRRLERSGRRLKQSSTACWRAARRTWSPGRRAA